MSTHSFGSPSASPVTPANYEVVSDGYVEGLYSQILGRPATESEVAHWDRLLSRGVNPDIVADRIWDSLEHRIEMRNGTAPRITLKIAVERASAYGIPQARTRKP